MSQHHPWVHSPPADDEPHCLPRVGLQPGAVRLPSASSARQRGSPLSQLQDYCASPGINDYPMFGLPKLQSQHLGCKRLPVSALPPENQLIPHSEQQLASWTTSLSLREWAHMCPCSQCCRPSIKGVLHSRWEGPSSCPLAQLGVSAASASLEGSHLMCIKGELTTFPGILL